MLLFIVGIVNFFDCFLLSVVGEVICVDLGFSVIEFGVLFFVFLFFYGFV